LRPAGDVATARGRAAHFPLILALYDCSIDAPLPAVITDSTQHLISKHVDFVAAASIAVCREHLTSDLENIMFAYFCEKLGQWFELAEQRRHAEYLEQASDLADLERRMRHAERFGYTA
jgi:hypothetical protein